MLRPRQTRRINITLLSRDRDPDSLADTNTYTYPDSLYDSKGKGLRPRQTRVISTYVPRGYDERLDRLLGYKT